MPQLTCWPFLFATIWHISSAKMKKRKSQTQWDRELAHLLPARLPNHYYTKAAFTLLHNPPFLNILSPPLSSLGEEDILQPDYGCVFFGQTTKYEPLREKMQGKDVKEASSTSSSWQGKESSRPPRQVRAGVAEASLTLSPDEHAPMSMPAPAEMADNQSVVVKHGAVMGQRSLPSGPQRAHAHALIHLLSGLSSQWTHSCVKPQGWYWIQIHYRLKVNWASVDKHLQLLV